MRSFSVISSLVLLLVAGCGDSANTLKGSITAVYDTSFDTVSVRMFADRSTVQIDYTQGPVTEAVARAAVVVADVTSFVKGQELPCTRVSHIAPDGVDFPTMRECQVTFHDDLNVGAVVSGSFHATFVTEAGTERALYGDFEGVLEEVPL